MYNKNTNELKSSAKLHDRSETFKWKEQFFLLISNLIS